MRILTFMPFNAQCRLATRTTTATAVRVLDALIRVKFALTDILFPWLNCAKLFKKIINSGPVQACDTIIDGLTLMQNGCLLVGSALLLTTWVCFLGQKRFACPSAVPKEDEPIEDGESGQGRDDTEMGVIMGVAIPTNEPTDFSHSTHNNNKNPSYYNNGKEMDSVTSPYSTSNMATFNPLSPTTPAGGGGAGSYNNTMNEQVSSAESRRGDSTVIVMGQSALGDTVKSASCVQNNNKVSPNDSYARESSTPPSPRADNNNECQDIATDDEEAN